jgi:hypothetical protein
MNVIQPYIQKFKTLSVPDRVQFFLSLFIRLSLIVAFVVALIETQWTVAFVSIIALFATLLPWYLARSFHIRVPIGFEFILVLFVYASIFLGEIHGFYTLFWWWDIVLHIGSGVAIGFVGFLALYALYLDKRFDAKPFFIAFLSFSVAFAIGGLWEIFEFTMDSVFGFHMQKSAVDTMRDLIVDAAGALVASASGYLYLRFRKRGLGLFQYYLNSYFLNDRENGGLLRKNVFKRK